uniref:Proteasome (Prosome, macropain) assembly chaperone 4 n=1 Tax=Iconisemion striatum TaxID=60296 RepID=A0A1A7Y2K2_9TELE
MNEEHNGVAFEGISVHNFSEKILEQVVHFHVMKLDGGFFLWVGSAPVLSNLAVSMSSRYDSMPLSTLVMGDPSNTTASSLSQRLGKVQRNVLFYYHVFYICKNIQEKCQVTGTGKPQCL